MSKPEVEITWEVPRPHRMPSMYDEALGEVKKRPGQWARLRSFEHSSAAYSASGGLKKRLDDDRWQAAVRPLPDGSAGYGLYVRYRTDAQLREENGR
jgi:hypothetical protein